MSLNRFGLTGNHITIIAVTTILAITSGSVWSVSAYTNVALQDPVNGRKAAVDASRQTLVKDTRASTDIIQSNFVNFFLVSSSSPGCTALATPPAGRSLVVKTLAANTYEVSSPGIGKVISFYRGINCNERVASFNPPGVGVQNMVFEPGLVVPDGQKLWISTGTGVRIEAFGSGYLIPSAWGPPSVPLLASEPANSSQQQQNGLGNGG